jgi:glucosamine--fructose-6-phosphate aminotransferase (isomerizing)
MCGIVGIIGTEPVANRMVGALKRLEYRGYDSAGVATLERGTIGYRKAVGKLTELDKVLGINPLGGKIGIGHTRWATHGKPTVLNAHPHTTDKVAVVHNGIIENFRELLLDLAKDGYYPRSQTDTESVSLWITRLMEHDRLSPEEAVKATLPRLRGAFALQLMFKDHDDLLIVVCKGAPMAVGYGNGEMYAGSDAMALAMFTNRVKYLLPGDWAVVTPEGATIRNINNTDADAEVERELAITQASTLLVDRGNHKHFMQKEIYEQPETIAHTLTHYVDMAVQKVNIREELPFTWASIPRLAISACGTAYHAGYVARYWFERYANLPVDLDVASEYRYREAPITKGAPALFISQSGETADTLAVLRYFASKQQKVVSLLNVLESTIGRESNAVFPTLCGPEIGVASTKAFTAQLTALASLVIAAGVARGSISPEQERELVDALVQVPAAVSEALKTEPQIEAIAKWLSKSKHAIFFGRGTMYPLALEGALKLKEISYIDANGYAAGELKHGSIALIDENMPVIVLALSDELEEKTISNKQEAAARDGKIILITDDKEKRNEENAATIVLPKVHTFVQPIIAAIALQLLAYHTAVKIGTDVDQPRNLAKSVTVE